MSRFLLLLFVLVLPLQSVWASAALYCEHETTTSSKAHFGHHEHEHQAFVTEEAGKPATDGKALPDTDCGVCHSLSSVAAPARVSVGVFAELHVMPPPLPSDPMTSAPLRPLERPKWNGLA